MFKTLKQSITFIPWSKICGVVAIIDCKRTKKVMSISDDDDKNILNLK